MLALFVQSSLTASITSTILHFVFSSTNTFLFQRRNRGTKTGAGHLVIVILAVVSISIIVRAVLVVELSVKEVPKSSRWKS